MGAQIFDAVTTPFRDAFAWVLNKIPGMGGLADKIRGGVSGVLNEPKEKTASSMYVSAVHVTPKGLSTTPDTTNKVDVGTQTQEVEASNTEHTKLLTNILMALNTLNQNLEAGKISVNMDGQLLSSVLARNQDFRGGFGTNRA